MTPRLTVEEVADAQKRQDPTINLSLETFLSCWIYTSILTVSLQRLSIEFRMFTSKAHYCRLGVLEIECFVVIVNRRFVLGRLDVVNFVVHIDSSVVRI
jgi:hypothetical protein